MNPAQEVVTENAMFDFEQMKYPPLRTKPDSFFDEWGIKRENFATTTEEEDKLGGQLAYFKQVPYPGKGHPFPQALYAINFAKRVSKEVVSTIKNNIVWAGIWFIFTPKKIRDKTLEDILYSYTDVCRKVIAPYVLSEEFLTPFARELLLFIERALLLLGITGTRVCPMTGEVETVAHAFAETFVSQVEYDNAYRWRGEDAANETTKERLMENPRKELIRLAGIIALHDPHQETPEKFMNIAKLASIVLLLPRYKKIFIQALRESNFENFQMDKADRYHVLLYGDYNYLGKTIEERIKEYSDFHKDIGFPPRITMKSS